MAESVDLLALAGLLHDIGKFAQRAGWTGDRLFDVEARREFGYKHAMLSAAFARRVVPAPWHSVLGPIGNHHQPVSADDRTVQRADHLSADERDEVDDEAKAQPQQLLSIFSALKSGNGGAPRAAFLPLRPLALEDETLFAGPALEAERVARDYNALWEAFALEADQLRQVHETAGDLPSYLESMRLLLQKYTWCVPSSSYGTRPDDISLYDHARTTAALAAVLAGGAEGSGDNVALLVGGDLSGIQNFLYTITARGATSALRGRSFYLQLLTEAAARFLLRALGLPSVCLLYVGGGNFTLLARAGDALAIERAQAEIVRVLLSHHQGELTLACAAVPLTGADLRKGALGARWDQLREDLQQAKQRRFAALAGEELIGLFAPQGAGGHEGGACSVCGRENPGVKEEKRDDAGRPVYKCALCRSFEALGDDLRRARFLLLSEVEPPGQARVSPDEAGKGCAEVLAQLGMRAGLSQGRPGLGRVDGTQRHLLLALEDGLALAFEQPRVACGRRFLVNTTPLMQEVEFDWLNGDDSVTELPEVGRIKPFDILERQSRGIKRLGVLRMDMDDMGELFRSGFGEPGSAGSSTSLSRLAGLSFTMSLFFEGWLDTLAKQVNSDSSWQPAAGSPLRADRLYAIYSGGDDLFFVGSWDAVIEFAARVRRDLARYANDHPRIHASAGVVLVGGKYPLYQAAKDAGAAEAKAKAYPSKDAVTFLGETLPWSHFANQEGELDPFASVQALAEWLQRNLAKGDSHSILRKVLDQYGEYLTQRRALLERHGAQGADGQPQTPWGPWTWRSVYYLKRAAEGSKADGGKEAKELTQQLAQQLAADYQLMERLGVAARWAEYLTRG